MKLITILFALFLSLGAFANDSLPAKKAVPKDSASLTTELLTFKDVQDLENFMKENLLIKDMPIFNGVLDWLRKRVQERAIQYNSRLK